MSVTAYRHLTPTGPPLDLGAWVETDDQVRAPDTLGSTTGQRLKLKFVPDQSRPAGAEYSTEEESVLGLFVDNEGDFLPVPSGSDDPMESFNSKVWEDDDEDQQEEHFL